VKSLFSQLTADSVLLDNIKRGLLSPGAEFSDAASWLVKFGLRCARSCRFAIENKRRIICRRILNMRYKSSSADLATPKTDSDETDPR
jgi:hypothetical protein